jgi:6-pyruvoyltetrahydropterin/6-carboxytetrahydropterin synthase
MINVTKIFNFEMAHALYNYEGPCGSIHGHSYILHVTVKSAKRNEDEFIPPGFIIDFKQLKEIVNSKVIARLDHKLVLSGEYIHSLKPRSSFKNLFEFSMEPTAENLLLFISKELIASLPAHVHLYSLKLFETGSSYAEWINDDPKRIVED